MQIGLGDISEAVVQSRVLVIGGGAVGVCVAYYLARKGIEVAVLDQDELGSGCSYGNAGLVVPSFSIPTANPEALKQGLRWLFDPSAPFTIRPRADFNLILWLWRFLRACERDRMRAAMQALYGLGTVSAALHEELALASKGGTGYQRNGWLHVFTSDLGLDEGIRNAELVRRMGGRAETLGGTDARGLEPALSTNVVGAVNYPDDAHVQPLEFVRSVAQLAEQYGVTFRTHHRVIGMKTAGGKVASVHTDDQTFTADAYVIAAGAWTHPLLRGLGLDVPVQPAKGYSYTFATDRAPSRPLMLGEPHVVVSSIGGCVRLTGGLELSGFDQSLNAERIEAIQRAANTYLDSLTPIEPGQPWYGFRPLTPDGLPMIGPAKRLKNVVFATGHGTLGLTLAPVTGQLVAEWITGRTTSLDLTPFLPSRFGR